MRNNNKLFTLCWVPSHIGIHGNESADKLPVRSTTQALYHTIRANQKRSQSKHEENVKGQQDL